MSIIILDYADYNFKKIKGRGTTSKEVLDNSTKCQKY
jgi:hypothetical protein